MPRGRKPDHERHILMRDLYQSGLSLQEVGYECDCSKQAVHQIISRYFPHIMRPQGFGMNVKPEERARR